LNRQVIIAQKRNLGSKSELKNLRRTGKVPGVLHGLDDYSLPLTLDQLDLKKAISTSAGRNVLLNLEIEGLGSQTAMVENLQKDFLKEGVYLHVDLIKVSLDKKIDVQVPVMLVGQEKRVNDNGIVSQPIFEVHVQSKPDMIPEHFKIDISGMAVGDSVLMKDLKLPEGCDAVTAADEMLVSILHPRGGTDVAAEDVDGTDVAKTAETAE
jgi:large subunit ribosomal protein L25